MSYCRIHGVEYKYEDGCSECRNAEARQESRLSEISDKIEEDSYKRANPGDYKCPDCKYITLLRGASRCPICRTRIGDEYWAEVRRTEEVAAAEWKRAQPERLAKAARLQQNAQKAKETEEKTLLWAVFWACYVGYLVPMICLLLDPTFQAERNALYCPVFNWIWLLLWLLAGILSGHAADAVVWSNLFKRVILGLVVGWLTKPRKPG